MKRTQLLAAAIAMIAAQAAQADTVFWTDWTSKGPGVVSGTLSDGATSVGVTFTGAYSFAQTSGGTNYWAPNTPYLSATVSNAPPASDIVALNAGGTKTITFSQTVHNPLIALVSWNGNHVSFAPGSNLKYLSSGHGYWGTGSFSSKTSTSFVGLGELHGVIMLEGDFTSISFTDTSENWHGLTVGVVGVVPEPETYAMMLAGLGALGAVARRRRES